MADFPTIPFPVTDGLVIDEVHDLVNVSAQRPSRDALVDTLQKKQASSALFNQSGVLQVGVSFFPSLALGPWPLSEGKWWGDHFGLVEHQLDNRVFIFSDVASKIVAQFANQDGIVTGHPNSATRKSEVDDVPLRVVPQQ